MGLGAECNGPWSRAHAKTVSRNRVAASGRYEGRFGAQNDPNPPPDLVTRKGGLVER
jgi:hypothetical protein